MSNKNEDKTFGSGSSREVVPESLTDSGAKTIASMTFWGKISYRFSKYWKNLGYSIVHGLSKCWKAIVEFFVSIWTCFIKGDWATKLSFLIFGFGYFFHGVTVEKKVLVPGTNPKRYETKRVYQVQWLRGIACLVLEVLIALVIIYWAVPNISKLNLQNLKGYEDTCSYVDGDKVCTGSYDNSFLILLYSVVSILLLVLAVPLYFLSVKGVYKSQVEASEGRPINSAKDDLNDLVNGKFYITVLAIPVIGILLFTVVPLIFMIAIAFTNYDGSHNPPSNNFSWVGWKNFATMFGTTSGSFGMIFGNQLLWTLEWAVLATITCFFGGLILALLLNSKKTRFVKTWRTCFVITIAVPQFVTLMLIRYFLADGGIVNSLFKEWGFTAWAKSMGWLGDYNYFPFLNDPTWAKWTIIFVNMWVGFPYLMLIISGILMNIPQDLYESAEIDGAGKQRMFWQITMPYILQVTGPYLISQFVGNINNFNVIYLLTSGYSTTNAAYGLAYAKETDLLVTWLFNMITGNNNKYYLASVVGIMMFVVTSTVTLLTFTQTTKGNRERRFQ